MPKVEVRLYATLRQYRPHLGVEESLPVELPKGATVRDLIAYLELPADEVKQAFVNHRAVPEDTVLQDGDRVSIFPLVAGG